MSKQTWFLAQTCLALILLTALPRVAKISAAEPYIVYSKNYMESIYPETVPNPEDYTDTISIFASPGEYEPATFAIYAQEDLHNVEVATTALEDGSGNKVPRSSIDSRIVKIMEKRRHRKGDPNDTIMVPEILDYYQSTDIPAHTSKQYWLTVHIPEDIPPGNYSGKIGIISSNAPKKTLRFRLEVLPIKLLDDPGKVNGIYYNKNAGGMFGLSQEDVLAKMEKDLVDLKEHGARGIVYFHLPHIEKNEATGEIEVDYTFFVEGMKLIDKIGFEEPVPHQIAKLGNLYAVIEDEQERDRVYVEIVEELKRITEENNWPELLFYPVDEPRLWQTEEGEEKREQLKHRGGLIKEVPGTRIYTTILLPPPEKDLSYEEMFDDLIDVRCHAGYTVDARLKDGTYTFKSLLEKVMASGDEAWLYWNAPNSYEMDIHRLSNGFYFWNSCFSHHYPWTYQLARGDIFDDTDKDMSDVAYAYPDPDQDYAPTLPSLKWEAYREGVDDIRYLYTLEQRIGENKDNPERQTEVQNARDLIDELKGKLNGYGPGVVGILDRFELDDYQNYRYRIAKAIVELQEGAAVPGDANGDGVVNRTDLELLQEDYLGEPVHNTDFNSDGRVDIEDFVVLQSNYEGK